MNNAFAAEQDVVTLGTLVDHFQQLVDAGVEVADARARALDEAPDGSITSFVLAGFVKATRDLKEPSRPPSGDRACHPFVSRGLRRQVPIVRLV